MSAVKFSLTLKEFHQSHKDRDHGKDKTASYKEYRQILYAFGDILGDELLQKGAVRFPYNGWRLSILKTKTPFVDNHLSKVFEEKTFNFNDHTDGFSLSFHLETNQYDKKLKQYKFTANRNLKRAKLSALLAKDKSIIGNYRTVIKEKS